MYEKTDKKKLYTTENYNIHYIEIYIKIVTIKSLKAKSLSLIYGLRAVVGQYVMLRSHEGQNVWRCTADENYVFWWRWVPMSNVWSHEKTHTRCLYEPSGNLRGSITDASPIIRRYIGEYSGINRRYIG